MARTQKNKATSNHLGLLKARLAKLRRELICPKGGSGGGTGEGEMFLLYTTGQTVLISRFISASSSLKVDVGTQRQLLLLSVSDVNKFLFHLK